MTKTIHFEIFVRRGKSGWALLEAMTCTRTEALKRAKDELGKNGIIAVKVTKECFDPETGTFTSVTIHQDGQIEKKGKSSKIQADEPVKLPCFKPQDLFSHHSRSVIARVLKSTLEEWQLIPMELIHRADMLEKLEARSTVLQGAVQQVAVAQAADAPGSLHEVFRQLMDLSLKAIDMVVVDERKGRLKPLAKDSVSAFWQGRPTAGDSGYHLAAAIAKHLKKSDGWAVKIRSLLELMQDLPNEEEKRKISLETIDSFSAEMIRSAASISDLLGPREDLGAAVYALASLFLGKEDAADRPRHLEPLAQALSSGKLQRARGALAERILHEIKSPKRFHPDSFERELETMRHLAQQLVLGTCAHLSLDAVTDAFASRSKRLVAQDQMEAYLETAANPDERIARLIRLEENIVGSSAKRAVAAFLRSQLSSPKTEAHFSVEGPILARLKRIAEHQAAVRAGHFEGTDRADILKSLDLLAQRIEERAHFFKTIEAREASSADKALGLLRLLEKGMLPQGECDARARALATLYLKRADFAATLCPESLPAKERAQRTEELKSLLEATGLKAKEPASAA